MVGYGFADSTAFLGQYAHLFCHRTDTILFFLIDYIVNKNKFSIFNFQFSKLLIIGGLIILANLVNPNFVVGALYPFKVLNNYGYSVAENSSLFFWSKYFGSWAPQDKLFLMSFFSFGGKFCS